MADQEKHEPGHPRLTRLRCRRTGELVTPSEHEECPYCQGQIAEIDTGKYERFCDYKEGEDPIHFGFPEGTTRHEEG
jgi:hypothetical protein